MPASNLPTKASALALSVIITLFAALLFSPGAQGANAGKLVNKLKVSAERDAGYDRDLFKHWIDANNNNCDTRDEVLLRQNKASRAVCNAATGRWFSAYDGLALTNSSDLDVDHFVPLAEAWRSGARRWNAATRTRYANDLYGYSLLAVSAGSNRSKSDQDPSQWLPPRQSFRCQYLARWVAVKYRWRLSVDRREVRALKGSMRSCSKAALRVNKLKRAKISTRPSSGGGSGGSGGKLDPRFPTCTAAKAAGYGPYYRGRDPEYKWYRDADGDGVVCE
jgi:hypothetical protein